MTPERRAARGAAAELRRGMRRAAAAAIVGRPPSDADAIVALIFIFASRGFLRRMLGDLIPLVISGA